MIYDVTAIALNPETGEVVAPPRTERIDIAVNEIFEGTASPWEVEDRYEQFWNRLNASWEKDFPKGKEKVKVLRVERVS